MKPSRARYLVELSPSALGQGEVRALGERCRLAARAMSSQGTPVRYLRTIVVPEDLSCFLLFDAESAEAARRAAGRAVGQVDRVSEAPRIDGVGVEEE